MDWVRRELKIRARKTQIDISSFVSWFCSCVAPFTKIVQPREKKKPIALFSYLKKAMERTFLRKPPNAW